MPIQPRSIAGKVDPTVEQQLRDLTQAVNTLEIDVQRLRIPVDLQPLRNAVQEIGAQLVLLEGRVRALEAAP